jgi:hypothetical protein
MRFFWFFGLAELIVLNSINVLTWLYCIFNFIYYFILGLETKIVEADD